ncbi:GntR family transcriptional regulator [Paenibacillus marinisediminis]
MDIPNKPLYALIIEHIQRQIEEGKFLPHDQIPTEMELAEQFGVSRITTKRALVELERSGLIYRRRGSGSYVKERQQSEQLDIQRTAELLPSKRIISIILPYMVENGHVGYLKGISDLLESKGYYLSLHSSDWDAEKERELLIRLPKHGFDGIILYPLGSMHNLDIVHMHYLNGYPLVTIDQYYDGIPLPSVVSDNRRGGYLAAQHLIELGHRRIAYVSSIGIEYRTSVRDRYFGYCQALKEHSVRFVPELVICDFYRQLSSDNEMCFYQDMARALIARGATAVVTEHDQLALVMMSACLKGGIRIPEQLSFVGFDDIDMASHYEIPLSTVTQNYYEIGKCAAQLLINQFNDPSATDPDTNLAMIPVEMKRRLSSASIDNAIGER